MPGCLLQLNKPSISHCCGSLPIVAGYCWPPSSVSTTVMLESPTTALRAGLANTEQREKLLSSASWLQSLYYRRISEMLWLWAKTEPCTPNCQCTHWSKTITSSCFVYRRANLRARSLASDLQWKNSVIVSLWMSWVLKSNLLCTVLCVCREQTELNACYAQIP